jgi:hypothetical protein
LGDGVADDTAAFQAAINAMVAKGGGEIYIPGVANFYSLGQLNFTSNVPLILTGDGAASKLQRNAAIPAGHGWFDLIGGCNIKFCRLVLDGGVTVPTGLLDSQYAGDPLHALLTLNTTFWLHDGCVGVEWDDVTIQHTGGYSILCNAVTQDITDLYFHKLSLRNNRPHLFGSVGGDLNYGSWTGGVHFHGNGVTSTAMVRRARFVSCSAYRCTGNCFWQHLYGFSSLHEEIHFTDMHGIDIGLDFILFGGVTGGSLAGFTTRRVGYITLDDSTTPGVPKWRNGAWGVAVDHSGLAISTVITGGTMISTNGGAIDCDGMAQSSITNCVCRTPAVGDPEYTVDQIGVTGWAGAATPGGPNYAYGIQGGNTSNNLGGDGVVVVGNKLTNLSGGAIRAFAARNWHVEGNDIDHPGDSSNPPISVGNVSAAVNQRANQNIVKNNRINYDPPAGRPCIVEDASLGAFQAGDKNWIFGNTIIAAAHGLSYEFQKNAGTQSTTGLTFSSAFNGLNIGSVSIIQREGKGSDASSALKFYNIEGAQPAHQLMQLQPFRQGLITGPLLNLSYDGTANSGVYTTGNRSSSNLINDGVAVGKGYFDAFIALTDTSYLDADADLLPASVSLLRWDDSLKKWRQSVSVAAGSRVWTDFSGGSSSVAGADTQIQYNNTGAAGADANFVWQYTPQALIVRGKTGVAAYPALTVTDANSPHTAFIQSDGGFYTPNVNSNAIQAPLGGILALQGAFTSLVQSPVFNAANVGALFTFQNINGNFSVNGNGVVSCAGFVNAAGGFLTTNTNFNSIQAPSGGMFALSFTASKYIQVGQSAGVPPLTFGDGFHPGAISWDTTGAGALKVFNGVSWLTPALSIVGTASQIAVAVAASVYTLSFPNQIVITGVNNGQAILVNNGYIDCAQGFATVSASYQAFKAYGNGGSWARSHFSQVYTQIGHSSGPPLATAGDAIANGVVYYDDGTNRLRAMIGGSFADLLTTGSAGVSSLNGLAGALSILGAANQITVTPNGSSFINLTLPQAIGTASPVTFGSVVAGIFNATGAGTTFQNSNFSFSVDSSGNISAIGSLNMTGANAYKANGGLFCNSNRDVTIRSLLNTGGGTLINTAGQFVGPGVAVGNNGLQCRGVNPQDGAVPPVQWFGIDAVLVITGVNHRFVGGVLVS